jgi:Zn-finger nucleic acid-binding protein
MKQFVCPFCKGTKKLEEKNIEGIFLHKCPRCKGTGYVDKIQDNER